MSALTDFQVSVQSSDSLVEMYQELRRSRGLGARGRLDAANEDLLWLPRSAVVAAVSALDSYVHSVLYEQIPKVLAAPSVPEPLCKALAEVLPIRNANQFAEALPIISSVHSLDEIFEKYRSQTLAFLAYQAPGKIVAGYALIGYDDVFENVAGIWPGPRTTADDLKRQLNNYVQRRNNIAHEGDRDHAGNERPMQPQYAARCKDFVSNLVTRLNRIVYGI